MNGFDTAAVLIAVAAVCGYFNHKVLRLPATSGTLAVALLSSLSIVGANLLVPSLHLHDLVATFVGDIDFDEALMHGMLAFLLFAGALHVDLEGLLEHRWTIGLLATVGVVVSTAVIGMLMWAVFAGLGQRVPFLVCLIFGALISPTDPIAVMGLLKDLAAPPSLEAQIAGESLFNDGVGRGGVLRAAVGGRFWRGGAHRPCPGSAVSSCGKSPVGRSSGSASAGSRITHSSA